MATTSSPHPTGSVVDLNALRTNQTLIVAFVAIGFISGAEVGSWLIAAVGASLAIGAALPGYGPFQLLYRHAVRPTGLVQPDPRPDDPAPHRFAQALGAAFLIVAAVALFSGVHWLGWTLAWLCSALALVNLLFGFCAGCFAFYHLRRLRRSSGATA